MVRNVILAVLAISACIVTSVAVAREGYSRREIRQMPILERPSRPGHFYGNAVRRRNGVAPQPARAWSGYSTAPRVNAWTESSGEPTLAQPVEEQTSESTEYYSE